MSSWSQITERQSGTTVHLKKGNFRPIATLSIPESTHIVGHHTTFYFDENSAFPVVNFCDVANSDLSGVDFRGATLIDQRPTEFLEKFKYNNILSINDSRKVAIRDCGFQNSYGTALKITDSNQVDINSCQFDKIGVSCDLKASYTYDGIFVGGYEDVHEISISNCSFSSVGSLFPSRKPRWPNDGDGIHIQSAGKSSDIKIFDNKFSGCTARGVKIQTGDRISLVGNVFSDCGSAVNLAMAQSLDQIEIKENRVINCKYSFGSDCLDTDHLTASNISIINNEVDSCVHFFRTSGNSTMKNAVISGNSVQNTGTYFLAGRFVSSIVENNRIGKYASGNDPDYNMIIYVSPESDNLTIRNNVFGKSPYSRKEIENFSKNKVLMEHNRFIPSLQTRK